MEDQPKTNAELYEQLLAEVKTAIQGQEIATVTFLWMQGESDAREITGLVYAASLNRIFDQLKTDLGRKDIHVVIGRLSDFGLNNKKYPHWSTLRQVQVEIAESHPRGAWVNTDDLNDGLNRKGEQIKNDLHYSDEGYVTLGQRFADKAIALIKRQR